MRNIEPILLLKTTSRVYLFGISFTVDTVCTRAPQQLDRWQQDVATSADSLGCNMKDISCKLLCVPTLCYIV